MKDSSAIISLFPYILLALAAVGFNSLGQTLLKLGAGQSLLNLYIFGGLSAYGVGTISYIFLLGRLNLSIAYPIIIGLTTIVTTLSGSLILQEQVLPVQWFGIGLMLSGILAISGTGWR